MDDIPGVLRKKGYRVTTGRLQLLEILKRAGKPLTILDILKSFKGRSIDQATLYRALESLSENGIISRVDLRHGHTHYELQEKHHHHLVCTDCGVVENVDSCLAQSSQKNIIQQSKLFKSIYSHNLEFFGQCTSCLKT